MHETVIHHFISELHAHKGDKHSVPEFKGGGERWKEEYGKSVASFPSSPIFFPLFPTFSGTTKNRKRERVVWNRDRLD
jgi:hypothetical protein